MAVTNFRASDFPKGKKSKEGKSPAREDNKILDDEVDKAVRDKKEGAKDAKELAAKVEESEETIKEEISRTETPLEEQDAPKTDSPKKSTRKTSKK